VVKELCLNITPQLTNVQWALSSLFKLPGGPHSVTAIVATLIVQ